MAKKEKRMHIIYISVIVFLIGALLVLSFHLYHSQWKDKNLTDHQKYYQSKCNSFTVQNFNLSKGQIVFLGDSITDLYPLDDYYADLDLATYNRGIGGDTTQGVLDRMKVSLYDLTPSKIVLLIGTNDINGGVKTEKIVENYAKILSEIERELPEAELYCVSVIPQNTTLETYTEIKVSETTARILEMNKKIQEIVKNSNQAVYVDLFSLLADENNMLIKKYSDDGIHLNENGFQVWTELLMPYLKAE